MAKKAKANLEFLLVKAEVGDYGGWLLISGRRYAILIPGYPQKRV